MSFHSWHNAETEPPNLDSSLKKHTTLLNRLRTNILVGPAETLIKEIDGLTLLKYLEEIVGAVVEGVSRGRGDPEAAVDVSLTSEVPTLIRRSLSTYIPVSPPTSFLSYFHRSLPSLPRHHRLRRMPNARRKTKSASLGSGWC